MCMPSVTKILLSFSVVASSRPFPFHCKALFTANLTIIIIIAFSFITINYIERHNEDI